MAFDVVVTSSALRRLNETIGFLRFVCCNDSFAESLLDEVEVARQGLETKTSFHIVDQSVSEFVDETVYRIKIGHYKLIYKVDKTSARYIVFLFMHESQDLDVSIMRDFESAN